jgi:hypothetical protein
MGNKKPAGKGGVLVSSSRGSLIREIGSVCLANQRPVSRNTPEPRRKSGVGVAGARSSSAT